MAKDLTNPAAPTNKPMGFLAYANKRHYPTMAKEDSPPPQPQPQPQEYKQCMRNHAASIGGHALDGCCEFMPSPLFNASDPTSLRCAACGCHRNFHRHDGVDSESPSSSPLTLLPVVDPHPESMSKSKSKTQQRKRPSPCSSSGGAKKRFRTRFSQEQKDMMYNFAERLGWKMQKVDRSEVEEFCTQIGVPKEVLKVWIHNNKNTLATTKDNHSHKEMNNNGAAGDDRFQAVHLLSANASSSSSD